LLLPRNFNTNCTLRLSIWIFVLKRQTDRHLLLSACLSIRVPVNIFSHNKIFASPAEICEPYSDTLTQPCTVSRRITSRRETLRTNKNNNGKRFFILYIWYAIFTDLTSSVAATHCISFTAGAYQLLTVSVCVDRRAATECYLTLSLDTIWLLWIIKLSSCTWSPVEIGSPADVTVSGYSVRAFPEWRQNVFLNGVIKKFFIMDEQCVFLRFLWGLNLIRKLDSG